ncbi:MAG: hypothetical protein JXR19_11790 [Bacteroidia bacterium]
MLRPLLFMFLCTGIVFLEWGCFKKEGISCSGGKFYEIYGFRGVALERYNNDDFDYIVKDSTDINELVFRINLDVARISMIPKSSFLYASAYPYDPIFIDFDSVIVFQSGFEFKGTVSIFEGQEFYPMSRNSKLGDDIPYTEDPILRLTCLPDSIPKLLDLEMHFYKGNDCLIADFDPVNIAK